MSGHEERFYGLTKDEALELENFFFCLTEDYWDNMTIPRRDVLATTFLKISRSDAFQKKLPEVLGNILYLHGGDLRPPLFKFTSNYRWLDYACRWG